MTGLQCTVSLKNAIWSTEHAHFHNAWHELCTDFVLQKYIRKCVGIGITCLSCGKIIKSFNASLINLRCLIQKGLLIKMSTRNLLKMHSKAIPLALKNLSRPKNNAVVRWQPPRVSYLGKTKCVCHPRNKNKLFCWYFLVLQIFLNLGQQISNWYTTVVRRTTYSKNSFFWENCLFCRLVTIAMLPRC